MWSQNYMEKKILGNQRKEKEKMCVLGRPNSLLNPIQVFNWQNCNSTISANESVYLLAQCFGPLPSIFLTYNLSSFVLTVLLV